MTLESTIILVDNSEYQRNGDYFPNRLIVQKDGINFICQSRNRANVQNDFGLITCSEPCQVICSPIQDQSIVFRKLHDINIKGNINLLTAIKIGHLTLKHRQSKQNKMRIIAFVGSPLEIKDPHDFQQLAKRLKKEKVNVDIVSFGGHIQNEPMLVEFVDTLNGKSTDNAVGSHLLVVPRGTDLLKALVESPILHSEGDRLLSPDAIEFGFDLDADPELAFALRISREEELQRQQYASSAAAPTNANEYLTDSIEEERLQRVLNDTAYNPDDLYVGTAMTEEEEIEFALRMSMERAESEDTEMTDISTENANNQNQGKSK